HITSDNRTALAEFKAQLDAGKIAFVKPVVGPDGKTAVLGAYDRQGNLVKTLDRSIGPAWMLPTVRSSVEVKEDGNGGYIYVPKTSTTSRTLPTQPPMGAQPAPGAQQQNLVLPSGNTAPAGNPTPR